MLDNRRGRYTKKGHAKRKDDGVRGVNDRDSRDAPQKKKVTEAVTAITGEMISAGMA